MLQIYVTFGLSQNLGQLEIYHDINRGFSNSNLAFKVIGYAGNFSAILYNGGNFCGFLFPFLQTKAFPKIGIL